MTRLNRILDRSIGPICLFFVLIVLVFNLLLLGEQHFVYLARSFLAGRVFFLEPPKLLVDTVYFGGRYYWPLGPFPAGVLMPFVYLFSLFGQFFYQEYLKFLLALAIFYLIFRIARKFRYDCPDSLFLAFAFIFSTVFMSVVALPFSSYLAQVMGVFLLVLAFYEFFYRKRYRLIGTILGFLLLTRASASLAIIFFLLEIFFLNALELRQRFKKILELIVPFIIFGVLFVSYNYVRFGSFFEQGYSFQTILPAAAKARDYGLFSLIHLPGNLYYFLLSLPLPVFKDNLSHVLTFPFIKANPWGMSIFVTSPIFAYLFFLRYKDRFSKIILISIALIALPIFLYYGIGFVQIGYRYSLDFLPLLFFLLMRNYKKQRSSLARNFKLLVIFSALFNFYLLLNFVAGW